MKESDTVIKIREAEKRDISDILRLWMDLMDYHSNLDPAFERSNTAESLFVEWLEQVMEMDKGIVLVADEDEVLKGYLLAAESQRLPIFVENRIGVIYDISVDYREKRRGIGINLARTAVYWFQNRNIAHVECNVSTMNKEALAFWAAAGFKPYMETLRFRTIR